MTTIDRNSVFDFVLDPEHEAHEPPEARGGRRDGVRLLVSAGDLDAWHDRSLALVDRRARRRPARRHLL
jgi:hypothetical protein